VRPEVAPEMGLTSVREVSELAYDEKSIEGATRNAESAE
jgi:hypothetical protein